MVVVGGVGLGLWLLGVRFGGDLPYEKRERADVVTSKAKGGGSVLLWPLPNPITTQYAPAAAPTPSNSTRTFSFSMAAKHFMQWLGQLYALMLSRPAVAYCSQSPGSVSSLSSASDTARESVGLTRMPLCSVWMMSTGPVVEGGGCLGGRWRGGGVGGLRVGGWRSGRGWGFCRQHRVCTVGVAMTLTPVGCGDNGDAVSSCLYQGETKRLLRGGLGWLGGC